VSEEIVVSKVAGKILNRPEFGTPPPVGAWQAAHAKTRVFAWEETLDKVKEHPGVWAKIAVYTKGTRKVTAKQVSADKQRIKNWLNRNRPLETWTVSQRTTPDTWFHRELWVRYGGELTPAQAAEKARKSREFGLALANKRVKSATDKAVARHFDVA
jgi:hypothetical protein